MAVEGRFAIATQGPLQTTVKNFWRMVYDNNINNIFMMCNLQ
jgi:protein tyrosine phosphatase